MDYRFFCFLLSIMILLGACKNEPATKLDKYLFLGHIYRFHGNSGQVDQRIESLNLKDYKGIWLGGDIHTETSLKKSHLVELERLFKISAPSTLWALGNHDIRNGNQHWIKAATGRNNFYAHWEDGFTVLVLDTNIPSTDCKTLQQQQELITNVIDTIDASSHLILLHHHAIWGDIAGLPESYSQLAHGNFGHFRWNCLSENNRFDGAIYPLLVGCEQKGIEVICVSGDAGSGHAKGQHFSSPEGIEMMTSGIGNSQYAKDPEKLATLLDDKVLVFEYDRKAKSLNWRYESLKKQF